MRCTNCLFLLVGCFSCWFRKKFYDEIVVNVVYTIEYMNACTCIAADEAHSCYYLTFECSILDLFSFLEF